MVDSVPAADGVDGTDAQPQSASQGEQEQRGAGREGEK